MPRLAAQAARDLVRPIRTVHDGLRAIDAWFRAHGDPFVPLDPPQLVAELGRHRDNLETLSNAELIARMWNAFGAFQARLELSAREE